MIENLTEPFNSIVYGFAAFMVSFVLLSILWSMFLKLAESFFSKSKLYFIPKVLKEMNRSIFLAVIMISIYFGVMFYDSELTGSALMKVWGVVLILIVTELVAKLVLNILDHYHMKSRKSPTFISNAIPMMKRVIGIVLYAVAVLVIINYLNSEVGSIVAGIGFLVLIFLFVLYYEQLKNIMSGFQMIGTEVREGDYIKILGNHGFVEKIMEQNTIMRDIDGRTLYIPNSVFVKESVKNNSFSEGNLIAMEIAIDSNDVAKTKDRLSAICGKIALELEQVLNDYKPKVSLSEVKDGTPYFNVKFMITANADLRKIIDAYILAVRKEFKNNVKKIKM